MQNFGIWAFYIPFQNKIAQYSKTHKDDHFVKKTASNWMKNQKFKIPSKYAKFEPLLDPISK